MQLNRLLIISKVREDKMIWKRLIKFFIGIISFYLGFFLIIKFSLPLTVKLTNIISSLDLPGFIHAGTVILILGVFTITPAFLLVYLNIIIGDYLDK